VIKEVIIIAINEETCTILVLQYLSLIKPDGENKNTKGNKIKALIMAVKGQFHHSGYYHYCNFIGRCYLFYFL
jgi:phage/plasmid primase-like uncharacterized protein